MVKPQEFPRLVPSHFSATSIPVLALYPRRTPSITSKQNMVGRRPPMRVLAWLLASACAAHAGEATEAASTTTDQFKLLIGSVLMSDYIFRGSARTRDNELSGSVRHLPSFDFSGIFI